jgi:hypothetical protein
MLSSGEETVGLYKKQSGPTAYTDIFICLLLKQYETLGVNNIGSKGSKM